MEEIRIDVTVRGTRPLLQNKFFEDEKDNLSKKGRTYDSKQEAEKRLEKNQKDEICQPASHFEASMIKSATEFKFSGRKTYKDLFKAGVLVEPELIPHRKTEFQIDKRAVTVNRSKIWRSRPRFDDWELSFQIIIHDDRIAPAVVKNVLINAGKYHGVGDYRPKFGLFQVMLFKVRKNVLSI